MKLPRGLTRTPTGWRITVKAHGRTYRKRYAASVPLAQMQEKLQTARDRMGAGRRAPLAGTLKADIARYLTAYYQGRPGYAERARHLALWAKELGTAADGSDTWRADLTREHVSTVLHRWLKAGLSPETVNKRRTALMALWHALDGRSAANPVRDVPKFKVPAPVARGLDYQLVERALKLLPKCATRARLKVMVYTGARPVELRRITPDDWDAKRRTLLLQATAKGAGTKPRLIPLSDEATKALEEFDATEAWGAFASAPMARLWREAWYAMTRGIPRTPRLEVPADFTAPVPYDLRHSFGTRIYRRTGDLRATKELMGHASLQMTERYTLSAVPERAAAALKAAFPAKVPTKVTRTTKHAKKAS